MDRFWALPCFTGFFDRQALLERVGSVTEPRSFAVPDWRRRPKLMGCAGDVEMAYIPLKRLF